MGMSLAKIALSSCPMLSEWREVCMLILPRVVEYGSIDRDLPPAMFHLVVFLLAEQQYALPLPMVERIAAHGRGVASPTGSPYDSRCNQSPRYGHPRPRPATPLRLPPTRVWTGSTSAPRSDDAAHPGPAGR